MVMLDNRLAQTIVDQIPALCRAADSRLHPGRGHERRDTDPDGTASTCNALPRADPQGRLTRSTGMP